MPVLKPRITNVVFQAESAKQTVKPLISFHRISLPFVYSGVQELKILFQPFLVVVGSFCIIIHNSGLPSLAEERHTKQAKVSVSIESSGLVSRCLSGFENSDQVLLDGQWAGISGRQHVKGRKPTSCHESPPSWTSPESPMPAGIKGGFFFSSLFSSVTHQSETKAKETCSSKFFHPKEFY